MVWALLPTHTDILILGNGPKESFRVGVSRSKIKKLITANGNMLRDKDLACIYSRMANVTWDIGPKMNDMVKENLSLTALKDL